MTPAELKFHIIKQFSFCLEQIKYIRTMDRHIFIKSYTTTQIFVYIDCRIKWGFPIFNPLVALNSDYLVNFHRDMISKLNLSPSASQIFAKSPNLTDAASLWGLCGRDIPETTDQISSEQAVSDSAYLLTHKIEPFVSTLNSADDLSGFIIDESKKTSGKKWPISRKGEKISFLQSQLQRH